RSPPCSSAPRSPPATSRHGGRRESTRSWRCAPSRPRRPQAPLRIARVIQCRFSMLKRVGTAGILTGITDGLFSSLLSAFFYGSTVARLWQGVAAVPFGSQAIGGTRAVAVGLLIHFCVALGWSAFFILGLMRLAAIRRLVESPAGVVATAAIYGPMVWM